MSLLRRQSNILRVQSDLDLNPGQQYTVTAYRPGSVLIADSTNPGTPVGIFNSNTDLTLATGHGLQANDRIMVGIDINTFGVVGLVAGNVVTLIGTYSYTTGDTVVNLGIDSGSTGPNYDGSDVLIYSTPDTTTQISQSQLTTNEDGEYAYYHVGDANLWELVRGTDGAPVAIVKDAFQVAPREVNEIRYAHLFATSGTGTEVDPWVTAGSNPVQAALDDLLHGGKIIAIDGWYDLGSNAVAVTVPQTSAATDRWQWTIEGYGKDSTIFNYSGIGTAIRIAQVNAGTPQTSRQGNRYRLKGFAIRQTGTVHTGIGLELQYVTNSIFEDLSIGRMRSDFGVAGHPVGFQYGVYCHGIASGIDNWSDYNQYRDLFLLGNIYAMDLQKGVDATCLENLWVEPDQGSATLQYGVSIYNSHGVTVKNSHFNFFHGDAGTYGLKLDGYNEGVTISGNYFEGNSIAVLMNNYNLQHGINLMGNYVQMGASSLYGFKCGTNNSVNFIEGLNIIGNDIHDVPGIGFGIWIGSDVKNYLLLNNKYFLITGNAKLFIVGSTGIEMESATDVNIAPRFWLRSIDPYTSYIILENTDTVNLENSPGIIFKPGGSGARPQCRLEAGSNGDLYLYDNNGVVVGTWSQAGNMIPANLTSVGHIQGGLYTQAFTSNDTIAHSGRTVVDITNTSGTNTLVVAAPSSVDGKILILRVKAITAGSFVIADSGNCSLSAAWDSAVGATVGSTLTLIASGTVWYEVARSKNT